MEKSLKRGDQQGTVLVLVLLVLALISVLILAWAQEWRVELKLTSNFQAVHQSRRLAEAGVYYAIGKLAAAKLAAASPLQSVGTPATGSLWLGDQSPHILELPEGKAEIRVADEAGKINLNLASGPALRSLFTVLGVTEPRLSIMVDSLLDWRSPDNLPHPFGAKSDYYLGLNPPYAAKNGKFDVVGELAWVRGYESYPLLPRLGDLLTVQHWNRGGNHAININTAPLKVLEAMGFSPENAQAVIAARQAMPFQNSQEVTQMVEGPLITGFWQMTFQASPFFTITSTGRAKNREGSYIIKAVVRIDVKRANLWEIDSWFDGFPNS